MPAKGYQYYEVDSFPEWELGFAFETRYQGSLLMDLVDEGPRTVITAVGLADHQDFKKYHVMHETYQSLRGRYRNEPIAGYIAQADFHIYYHPVAKRMFVDTARSLCREMVDRLERSDIDFLVIPRNIDLRKLAEDLRANIRAGWFRDLKVADVSTIGLFGSTVGESAEWSRYELVGSLNVIDLELEVRGQRHPVKISSNRAIVLFESFSESEALGLILELQEALDSYEVHE
jgi:hypothetical protein